MYLNVFNRLNGYIFLDCRARNITACLDQLVDQFRFINIKKTILSDFLEVLYADGIKLCHN